MAMGETAVVDLPEYDVRRLITSRDPLCCVHAFQVMTRVVLPSLHGFRVCPDCPPLRARRGPLHGLLREQCDSYGWLRWPL